MNSYRRCAAMAALVAAPFAASACWPTQAAIGLIAAGGGGGGGGGGVAGIQLAGSIITDASSGLSLTLDREPNDTLGDAEPLPELRVGMAAHVDGTSATRATVHLLLENGDAAGAYDILGQELLDDAGRRFALVDGPQDRPRLTPRHMTRVGNELFVIETTVETTPRGARVRVTPLVSPFTKREIALPSSLEPAGCTALFDSLVVLDAGGSSARLLAFDLERGTPIVMSDLGRDGLVHLAGTEELATGRPRLFTSDPAVGEILEIALIVDGGDRRFGGLARSFAPPDLVGGIAALGYDGALLQVVDGAGTLHSVDPDQGKTIARRQLVPAGARPLSLVAHLDLGLDGYHVEVPAGERLAVTTLLPAASNSDHRLFTFALARSAVADRGAATTDAWQTLDAAQPAGGFELSAADRGVPRGFDVVVGSLASGGSYRLAVGRAGAPPAADPRALPSRGTDARELAAHLEGRLFRELTPERLVALYRDPLLPDFVANRIVLGRRDVAGELAPPRAPVGFDLRLDSRSPSGWDIFDHRTTADWQGGAATTLHGFTTARGERRAASRETLALLDGLAGSSGVAWREPQFRARSLAAPTDPQSSRQAWHYNMLNLPAAWNTTTGSVSTVLACVDTGQRDENQDLTDNDGGEGFDFVSDPVNGGDGNGLDPDPYDEGSFGGAGGNVHHGSHTSGTMGAQANNGIQGSGINWDCSLMPLRALGVDGSGITTDIAEAIKYAARLANASGTIPSQVAAVINLSLGLSSPSNAIQSAIQSAIAQGCVVCCAAGNDGNGVAVLFPAAYPESIAVAAAAFDGSIALYSNTGPELDVTAPGGSNDYTDFNSDGVVDTEVQSNSGVGATGSLQPLAGTSMACAHASGVAGLMKTVFPAMTQTEARNALTGTAVDIETPGFDDFSGFGMIDANAAVVGATPVLDLTAAEVDFGRTGAHLLAQALNSGGGKLTVMSLATSAVQPIGGPTSWLAATVAADGKSILLAADRTGLATGSYQVQVDVMTNGGDSSFLVDVEAASGGVTDVGTVTVQVVASDGTTVVKSITTTAAANYAWSLAGIAFGQYFLRCGVDNDQDGVLGEAGEPFGTYPAVGAERLLELDLLTSVELDLLIQ